MGEVVMKIYIFADMEGISGIRRTEQAQFSSPEYAAGCQLMMGDMNAAIAAAFDAGATEVVACDMHGGGGQVKVEAMDARATYETPNGKLMMPSLDGSFDGLILLGHHARAGTLNGFLDHTMNSAAWFEFRINGQPVGEIGIEAAYAAHFDVPVIAVTGDEAAVAEARDLLGDMECAAVKRGIGRSCAHCLSIPEAHKRIREAVMNAVRNPARFKPWKPALPATIELTLYRSDMADGRAEQPGVERVDARTLRATIASLRDIRVF
jgi:D-amino peptidase